MNFDRPPIAALRACVERVWISAPDDESPRQPGLREHVFPTGAMHLAIRLDGVPLRLYRDDNDLSGLTLGDAVVGGARSGFYVKDIATPVRSIGAQLRPHAARALFGVCAAELAERHVALDDLCGADAARLRERVNEARAPVLALDLLEEFLVARLAPIRAMHPAVAAALQAFDSDARVQPVVGANACSHRHFIGLFREATGLAPKGYARVRRFQRALHAARETVHGWGTIAFDAGYSDQAHLCREFRVFTGVTPQDYRRSAPLSSHHLAVR